MPQYEKGNTHEQRRQQLRDALAGIQVTTPTELCIYMGLELEQITESALMFAFLDLLALGYERAMVPIQFYGPLEERWIRRERWPEDAQWD